MKHVLVFSVGSLYDNTLVFAINEQRGTESMQEIRAAILKATVGLSSLDMGRVQSGFYKLFLLQFSITHTHRIFTYFI